MFAYVLELVWHNDAKHKTLLVELVVSHEVDVENAVLIGDRLCCSSEYERGGDHRAHHILIHAEGQIEIADVTCIEKDDQWMERQHAIVEAMRSKLMTSGLDAHTEDAVTPS